MDLVQFWLIIHLLAMAFFVGGQLVMAAAVVPVLEGTEQIKQIARKFGIYSGVALVAAVVSGAAMASELDKWGEWQLHAKLTILVVLILLTGFGHMKRGNDKLIQAAMLILTLALVVLGVLLA